MQTISPVAREVVTNAKARWDTVVHEWTSHRIQGTVPSDLKTYQGAYINTGLAMTLEIGAFGSSPALCLRINGNEEQTFDLHHYHHDTWTFLPSTRDECFRQGYSAYLYSWQAFLIEFTDMKDGHFQGSKETADLLLQHGAKAEPIKDERRSTYAQSKVEIDAEELPSGHPPEANSHVEGPEVSDKGSVSANCKHNARDGVRCDGDGFILATYDNHDIFFDAKLESIRSSRHGDEDVHSIQLKLNFMKPFSMNHRLRYAKGDVRLREGTTGDSPHIRTIMPQADRVEVSEQEITSGQKLTVGASGNGGPSSVNISMEGCDK
ncbi:hypothetical protein CFD26_104121 [Aspergillus turcosus]|uniref:Uncharacterized protein n=1 Tax=Aspergillus turcosus TaxID=1245748 RepID=A0A421D0Y5_9EURO|nr:hypothetical protein CFD26_104121 [Aspergillus turcosus]